MARRTGAVLARVFANSRLRRVEIAFVGFSFATYNSVSASGDYPYFIPGDLGGSRNHTWFQLGLRAILFP